MYEPFKAPIAVMSGDQVRVNKTLIFDIVGTCTIVGTHDENLVVEDKRQPYGLRLATDREAIRVHLDIPRSELPFLSHAAHRF